MRLVLSPLRQLTSTIGRDVLRDSQLPNRISNPSGYVLTAAPHLELR